MHRLDTVLLTVLLLISTISAAQRPYEASCPRQCRCTAQILDCRGAKLTRDDLETVRPEAFPELDTLDFYQAKFGDISDGLFPSGVIHPSVTSLNLSDCGVTKIDSDTFTAVPKLEFLYLMNNNIEYAGRATFEKLKNLRKLDMTNSLKRRTTDKSNADLLALMFEARYPKDNLDHLTNIVLNNNGLKFIANSTFCKVQGLVRLELANNLLSNFFSEENCLDRLESLDLSNNNFTTATTAFWDHFEKVTAMDISGNPLQCDCGFQPFLKIAKSESHDFVNQELTKCHGPGRMKGKIIFEIKGDLCGRNVSSEEKGGFGWGTFFFLALIAGGALFAYRHYSRRRRAEVPFEFGYTGLEADDEDVRPEFV